MKKTLFLLIVSAFLLPSCSILKSKHCKQLEADNAKLQKESKSFKDANATLEKRYSNIDPKQAEKAAKYDNLAIKCADAFIVRDSLTKERQIWLERQKKILTDSINAYKVIAELSVKNKALEILKDSLQNALDKCSTDNDLYRASMFQNKTLGLSSNFEKKEADKKEAKKQPAKKEDAPAKEEPKKEESPPKSKEKGE